MTDVYDALCEFGKEHSSRYMIILYHRETLYAFCTKTGRICQYTEKLWIGRCRILPISNPSMFALEDVLLVVEPMKKLTIVYTDQENKYSTHDLKRSFVHFNKHVIGNKLFLDGRMVFDLADFETV